jgi:murein DD-endopeptidase MepM/ murein hydrolase activator NlpD
VNPNPKEQGLGEGTTKERYPTWLPRALWGVAFSMLAVLFALLVFRSPVVAEARARAQAVAQPAFEENLPQQVSVNLPAFQPGESTPAVIRDSDPVTVIPSRPSSDPSEYEIQKGDSLFGIAGKFDIKPESIMWANYDLLNDDPHMISVGLNLKIPPTDGVYYQWKEGDTLEKVTETYKADIKSILEWPGNKMDMVNPVIEPGDYIMIPGGYRELKPWVVAVPFRDRSGVIKGIAGPGGCSVPAGGYLGTGGFVWPAGNRFLSGNDYWSGHLAIDIAAGEGAPIYASDNGVVVYAGSIGGGYGNMIMIDHNNGYHTLYAHLSTVAVFCGQNVSQGQYIGLAGSTGNSTGAHLHFEIRYLGGYINPWYVLP